MWYSKIKKTASEIPASYYSIGHERSNIENTLLFVHDGEKLHVKKPEKPTQSHLSAFPGIEEAAKGRIETNKNKGSIVYFPPLESASKVHINKEFRKILSDLEQQFPNVIFYMSGEPVDKRTTVASNVQGKINKIAYNTTVRCYKLIEELQKNGFNPIYDKNLGHYIVIKGDKKPLYLKDCVEKQTDDPEINKLDENYFSVEKVINFLQQFDLTLDTTTLEITKMKPSGNAQTAVSMLPDLPSSLKVIARPTCGEIIDVLKILGFEIERQTGSHVRLKGKKPNQVCTLACVDRNVEKNNSVIRNQCAQCNVDENLFRWTYGIVKGTLTAKQKALVYKNIDRPLVANNYFNLMRFANIKVEKTAQFGAGHGEWWIDESGNTMYADIDIGDRGHEQYVIEHAQGLLTPAEYIGYTEDSWQDFLTALAEDLLDEASVNEGRKKQIEEYVGLDLHEINAKELVDQDYIEDYLLKEKHFDKTLMDIAMGRGDVRLFGVKDLGWKRVMNNFIDTWTLTPDDCAVITRGLGDIVPDDEEGKTVWNIEVRSTGKYYTQIPLNIIEQGPLAIHNYDRDQE